MMIQNLLQLLAVVSAGQGCLAKEASCIAMETSNGTIYTVHGVRGSNCDFCWVNSSNHVMANVGGETENVISSNSTHLHTHGCYETIVYSWDCMSEMSTKATCHVNCTRDAGRPAAPEHPSVRLMVTIAVSILSVVLVILVILFVRRAVLRRLKQNIMLEGNRVI